MNINALRDSDNDAGIYVAVTSNGKNWPGAILYRSIDDGASFQSLATITARATMGYTVNALANYAGGNTVDEFNHITVRLTYGTLSSVTYAAFINGQQAALVGDEVVMFRNAHLNADKTYTLTGLLRGRRGTEEGMTQHANGERFILLTPTTVKRIALPTDEIGKTRIYKAVTSGASLSKTQPVWFKNEGAALKPYSPAHLGGGRLADGSILISWIRRGRLSGEWRDLVDVPLSEESEKYALEICSLGFTSVIRTVTVAGATSYTYAAADQITDFGSVQSVVYVRVFQISATVGRGYAANAII